MIQLGISAFYHDSSACIVKDGVVLAAVEEERFTGVKHDDSFPTQSINWLFDYCKLTLQDIDQVCWYEKPKIKQNRVYSIFNKHYFKTLWNRIKFHHRNRTEGNIPVLLLNKLGYMGPIKYTTHHKSHAAFSFYTSPYKEAVVVSIDGVGEWETVSVYHGKRNKLTRVSNSVFPNSLGMLYSTITAFLGFKPNEGEYKVMGLAPYGNPDKYYDILMSVIEILPKGNFKIQQDCFTWEYSDKIMFNHNLCELLQLSPRLNGQELTQDHKDLAAAIQRVYETVFMHILEWAKKETGATNLCLGGGCAYNGVANNKAYSIFDSIWIPFSPSDSGSAIGTCLNHCKKISRENTSPYLGPEIEKVELKKAIDKFKDLIKVEENISQKIIEKAAYDIANGFVIGWCQDRMEFGARALGNRSILASPKFKYMKNTLNKVIKKREGFRPFAPTCIESKANTFFKIEEPIPYMNQVVEVRPEFNLPAITHIDGSARVQTITKSQNSKYYNLLLKVEELTGYPIVLNTSFNFKDQTITMTAEQAIERFLDCEMHSLVINNTYITKK